MPAVFPTLASGKTAMYPLTRTRKIRSEVAVFIDMTEQRYKRGSTLQEFQLTFTDVRWSDKELVKNFFNDRRGPFDTGWSLTLTDTDGVDVTWENLQFVTKVLEARSDKPSRWTISLRVRQTKPNGA